MTKFSKTTTLAEIGEFRILADIVLPLARAADTTTAAGDDCAFISMGSDVLAITTDVGPRPLIRNLVAYRNDWEASGWLAVVATASDVATAGAVPLFLANCIDAPGDLEVSVLSQFMSGYFKAMSEFGFQNAGGDLREGPTLAARVFGVGRLDGVRKIGRGGAKPGDYLIAIGPAGLFMASYLLSVARESHGDIDRPQEEIPDLLRFPRPQLRAMRCLAELGLVVASSDTSDGLIGAIDNISRASNCGFDLELNMALLSDEVKAAATLPSVASAWNLFFAWGDWSVAVVVSPDRINEFERCCRENAIEWRNLGRATKEPQRITAMLDNESYEIALVRNENFVSRSFNSGLQSHLDFILKTEILIPRSGK